MCSPVSPHRLRPHKVRGCRPYKKVPFLLSRSSTLLDPVRLPLLSSVLTRWAVVVVEAEDTGGSEGGLDKGSKGKRGTYKLDHDRVVLGI